MQACRGQITGRPAERDLHMICGIIEAEVGTFTGEALYRAYSPLSSMGQSNQLVFVNEPAIPQEVTDDHFYSRDRNEEVSLGSLLMSRFWTLAVTHGPSLQVYIRRTTAHSDPGKEIYAFSGILKQDADDPLLSPEKMHDLIILPDQDIMVVSPSTEDRHDVFKNHVGNQFDWFLKAPAWGWSDTPWGLNSTLAADLIVSVDELSKLERRHRGIFTPSLSDEEEARRAELNQDPRLAFMAGEKSLSLSDEQFCETLRVLDEKFGAEALTPYAGISTAADRKLQQNRMKEALNECNANADY